MLRRVVCKGRLWRSLMPIRSHSAPSGLPIFLALLSTAGLKPLPKNITRQGGRDSAVDNAKVRKR